MDSKKEKKRSPLALVIIAPATFWLAIDTGYGISEVLVNVVERVLSGMAVRVQITGAREKSEDKVSNMKYRELTNHI